MTVDLDISSRLLDIIARKLGHDYLLLSFMAESGKEIWYRAVFGQRYVNFGHGIDVLEADSKPVWLKTADAEGSRSNEDMYAELARLLYKTLESGGKLSDGKSEVGALDVSGFMIGCVLNGIVQ